MYIYIYIERERDIEIHMYMCPARVQEILADRARTMKVGAKPDTKTNIITNIKIVTNKNVDK